MKGACGNASSMDIPLGLPREVNNPKMEEDVAPGSPEATEPSGSIQIGEGQSGATPKEAWQLAYVRKEKMMRVETRGKGLGVVGSTLGYDHGQETDTEGEWWWRVEEQEVRDVKQDAWALALECLQPDPLREALQASRVRLLG